MAAIRYASVCDGIGAVHCAWHSLGWRCAWTSEIEPFPAAVVEHHWRLPNVGDMLEITEKSVEQYGPIQLLAGGTPCQSFSVAGLRGGLDDPRGNLALRFLQLAGLLRPEWLVWENVPGVLSSNGGRDFGSIVGGMAQLGYGWAYRVLDAQYVRVDSHARAVPQRRRRVFVVGHSGGWQRAAAVLFERACLSGHPAPRREAGARVAGSIAPGAHPGGFNRQDAYSGHLVHCEPASRSLTACHTATGRLDPNEMEFIAYRTSGNSGVMEQGDRTAALNCQSDPNEHIIVAGFKRGQGSAARSDGYQVEQAPTLTSSDSGTQQCPGVQIGKTVRRLTPLECERLQGFPDGYTNIPSSKRNPTAEHEEMVRYYLRTGQIERAEDAPKTTPDGPRYKALGNSMAVNVMRWIGLRIMQAGHTGE